MKGRIHRPEIENNRLPLPRIGLLKIGLKNERGFPQSVDYFIPVGKYKDFFAQAYGDKPQTIQIIFPDDDAHKVCNERYEYRDNEGRLIASGNGEIFNVWNGKHYEELTVEKYPHIMNTVTKRFPNKYTESGGDGWRIVLTLNFMVPLVRGIAGLWQFTTKGTASTIPQVRETFDNVLQQKGFCKGLVFDLNVHFATSQKPGDKSRYPVVSLVLNQSPENVNKVKEAIKPIGKIEN